MSIQENRLLVRGLGANYLHLFVGAVSVFLLPPIIITHLGQSGYGVWAIVSSVAGYFLLFDFGMNTAVAKYTAEYRALDRHGALNNVISTIFVAMLGIGVIIVLGSLALSPMIPSLFNMTRELVAPGRTAFLIMGVNFAILLVAAVFGNVIYGHQRVDIWKSFAVVQLSANLLLSVLFLEIGWGLIGLAVATVTSSSVLLLLYLTFLRRLPQTISISTTLVEWKVLKEIAPYSVRTCVLGLASRLLYYTSAIIIGIFLGVSSVTPYDVAYKLCFYATALFAVVSTLNFPRFAKLYAIGDTAGLQRLYVTTTKASIAIMAPLGIALVVSGRSLLAMWVGDENVIDQSVLVAFVVMGFIHSVGTPAGLLLQGVGENRRFLYSEVVNAGLNIALSILFIRHWGLLGVALGGLIAHMLTSTWIVPLLACNYTQLTLSRFLWRAVVPPLAATLFASGTIWMGRKILFDSHEALGLVANGLLITAVCASWHVLIASTNEEQRVYWRVMGACHGYVRRWV